MKPPPFDYVAPGTVQEAVSLLEQHDGEAKIIAGGQSLMPLLSMRMARPTVLIDLCKVSDLDYIRETDGKLAIGAMTTKRAVEDSDLVKTKQPLLHAATLWIGHPQIRNRGTVGGSIAHGDPAAEYPAVALAVEAEMVVTGPGGAKTVKAADFFVTYLTTALDTADILTEVRFPVMPSNTGWSIQETARRHGDFAMTGVVSTVTVEGGKCSDARIVLFAVDATPVRATAAEQAVIGQAPGEAVFETAAKKVNEAIEEPISDIHASAEYRRSLAETLTQRALAEAAARA